MANQPAPTPSGKTIASNVQLALGQYTTHVDLTPVRVANLEKVAKQTSICPSCTTPTKVSQRYVCDQDHTCLPGELHKAVETENGLARVTEADKEVLAENTFPTRQLTFEVLPAAVVEVNFRPDANAYRARFTSDRKSHRTAADQYAMLRALAGRPGYRLVGLLKVKEGEEPAVYVAQVWRNQLVLQSLIRPQNLAEAEEIVTDHDERFAAADKALDAYLTNLVAELDVERYRSGKANRHDALVAAKTADPDGSVPFIAPAAPSATPDLLDLLEQSLAQVPKAKGTRARKTPAAVAA